MREKIRFDEWIDKDLLKRVHESFIIHIESKEAGIFFRDKLRSLVTENQKLNIKKIIKNLKIEINTDDFEEVLTLIEGTCYHYLMPKMKQEDHNFTDNEKRFMAAFSMFVDQFGDENYPHQTPEHQVDELIINNIPMNFIETVFDWTIDQYVQIYKNEFLKH